MYDAKALALQLGTRYEGGDYLLDIMIRDLHTRAMDIDTYMEEKLAGDNHLIELQEKLSYTVSMINDRIEELELEKSPEKPLDDK